METNILKRMDKLNQTKNLFKKLIKDEKSVFYPINRRSRLLLGKAKNTFLKKDKAFYKHYVDLEDKNVLYESENPKKSILFYIPFVEQRKDIDRSSVLYSIKAPLKLMHVDIADIGFFFKLAVDPKYFLPAVDLFIYTFPMKSRHILVQNMKIFNRDIQPKRHPVAKNERMRLQVNLEFQQNEI